MVADARSNSLVVRSDNPSRLARLRNLVAMLDSPTSAAGNMHVVYLKNAEAVKLAETLRAIYLRRQADGAAAFRAGSGARQSVYNACSMRQRRPVRTRRRGGVCRQPPDAVAAVSAPA